MWVLNLLLLSLDNFQRSNGCPPLVIYPLFILFFCGCNFLVLLIEKENSFRLAYVHYIQEEEKIQLKANTMTCPPVRRMGQAGGQFVAD